MELLTGPLVILLTLSVALVLGIRAALLGNRPAARQWIDWIDVFFVGLRWVGRNWLRVLRLLFAILTAGALVVLLSIFVPMARRQTIDIEPIAVPQKLHDLGLTPEVAAKRLRDAIDRIIILANSSLEPPHFRGTSPEVLVYEVRLQPEAIAAWVGNWLHLRRPQDISGEITMFNDEQGEPQLRLRIRFNGEPFPGNEWTVPFAGLARFPVSAASLSGH